MKPMATINTKTTRYEQSALNGGYYLTECRAPNGRLILSEGSTEQQSQDGVKQIQRAHFIERQNNIRQHDHHDQKEGTVTMMQQARRAGKTMAAITKEARAAFCRRFDINPRHGYVVFSHGKPVNWTISIKDDAQSYRPGVVAMDYLGSLFVATGGDLVNGANWWQWIGQQKNQAI